MNATSPKLKVLILAGGRGSRLWPYSSRRIPKQFLSIAGEPSSFMQAVERALALTDKEHIFISSNKENFLHIKRQLRRSGIDSSNVLVKEDNFETGLSIFSALHQLKEKFSTHDQDVLLVMPSDHFIKPIEALRGDIEGAYAVARQGHIVTLGKLPTSPQEGFGYIVVNSASEKGKSHVVQQFIEKPPREVAEKLIAEKSCYWNLGLYMFPVGLMMEKFLKHFNVSHFNQLKNEAVSQALAISFDKMIIEKAKEIMMVEASFDWVDIGSWKAFYEIAKKDNDGNANPENQILVNSKNSLVIGEAKPIVTVGLKNVFIINHQDVLLAIAEDSVDAIKKAMPILEERYPRLVQGSPLVSICTTVAQNRKYIRTAIESVVAQRYPFIEHVIIDSGAQAEAEHLKKESQAMLSSANKKDGKTVDVLHYPNGFAGMYEAMNAAVQEATGDIIVILNNEDMLEDAEAIQSIVEKMEKENADVCWADLLYVREDDVNRITRFWQSSSYRKGLFQKGWMPPHPTFFVRRSAYERYGNFRTDLQVAGGYEFMLRVLEKEGLRGCYLPKIVVKMRDKKRKKSNRLAVFVRGNIESYKSWKLNGLKVSLQFIFRKPLSKIRQLLNKNKAVH